MIKAILYDKCHNTQTGFVHAKEAVVGRGISCADGVGRVIEGINESVTRGRDTLTITCTDGYQIIMPDRNIDKELKFE